MTQRIDRQGTFLGRVVDAGVKSAQSGAIAVTVHVDIVSALVGDDWEDWTDYEFDCFGDLWVVGKDGQPIDFVVRDLCKWAGWDGNLETVAKGDWKPGSVVFHVQPNEYEGIVRYRLTRFVDPDNPNGGTISGLDVDEVKALQATHGPAIRAIVGDLVDATPPKSKGKPKAKATKPEPVTVPDDGGPTGVDVPF